MDSSKFFNRKLNVRNPKSPYQKGNFVDGSKNYKSKIFSRIKETSTAKSLLSIRRKVIQIENTLQSIFNLNKKSDKVKQRFSIIQVENEKNNKKISSPSLGLGKLIQRPKTGVMDFISNFLTFTFLGWLFTKLQPLIGKLEGIIPILQGAFNFFGGTVRFLIASFGSFIQFGYSVFDGIKGAHDGIKAKKGEFEKSFNDTTKALGDLIDGTVKVATSFLDVFKQPYDIAGAGSKNENKTSAIGSFASLTSISNLTATAFASGGNVGDGRIDPRSPITRGIDKDKRKEIQKPKPSIQPQKTTPGKDVGGESKVKEIYGEQGSGFKFDFGPIPSFFRTDKKSGYNALLSASEEYKKPKSDDILGIGNLMGVSVDTTLGQKPEKKTYTQFADGIKYLVNYGMTKPEEFNKINLEEMVRRIVEPKVETAINKIREEINKKSSAGSGPPSGMETGIGGFAGGEYGGYSPKNDMEKKIYDYLINEKKINDIQALGLMANISRESSFIPNNKERGGTGVGLFQWSHGRVAPFIRAVPDWQTNWKAQIDYALSEPKHLSGVTPGEYQSRKFSTPQEAADWWMREWERPRDPSAGSIKHQKYLRSVPKAPDGSVRFREGEGAPEIKMEGGMLPSSKLGSKAGMRLHPITGKWQMHDGNDYPLPIGTPISVIKGGKVIRSGVFGGYGEGIEIEHFDGTRSFYAHLDKRNIKVGDKISPGTVIGTVGNTGRSTGPHLHFEFNDKNGNLITDHSKLNKIADNIFRFGGNVKPAEVQKLAKKGGKEGYINHEGKFIEQKWTSEQKKRFEVESKKENTPSSNRQPQQTPLPKLEPEKANEYADKLRKIKPGSGESLRINGIGTYVAGRDLLGRPVDKYFHPDGKPMEGKEFLNKVRQAAQKKKYGGVVYENSRKPMMPAEKYASYNDPMNTPQLVIQPIVIQTPVPVSSGSNSSIAFAIPKVNSTGKSKKLMRN